MALVLTFSVTERNDNKILTVADTSGTYHVADNPTGWGAPNAVFTTIVASGGAHTLELDVVVTTSDGTITTYDTIDLFTEFAPGGGFAAITDLSFPLDCTMLIDGSTALGTVDDEFPDGLYEITYTYDKGLGTEVTLEQTVLIDGKVQNAVYEMLRILPSNYSAPICSEKTTLDTIFVATYLDSVRASAVVSRSSSILDQLYTLERLVTNVSNYTW